MPARAPRQSAELAHTGPFFVFLLFLALTSLFKAESGPWYRTSPEQWVYPLQTVVCLGLIAWWWPHYQFRPMKPGALVFAAVMGLIGIALWILPSWLHDHTGIGEMKWLGVTSRAGDGFNPDLWKDQPGVYASALGMRFVRMTVAVPILEELFWRNFLWRNFADPYRNFDQVKIGTWSLRSLLITVPLCMAAHQPVDYAGCLLWALCISWVLVRTKSIGACIAMHAVSNLVLGIYVMKTGQWGFW